VEHLQKRLLRSNWVNQRVIQEPFLHFTCWTTWGVAK